MIENYLPITSIEDFELSKIKNNVYLAQHNGYKFIIKNSRKSLLELFRYLNEVNAYNTLNNQKFNYLNVPKAYKDKETGDLILAFVKVDPINPPVKPNDFTKAYQELQVINPKRSIFLELYYKSFLNYNYKILVVSAVTISRKVSLKLSFKIIRTFAKINFNNKLLSKKYWNHGDLHRQNYFYDNIGNLYFLDFENMFYTRKWPLVEYISHCITYNNKIVFLGKSLELYFKNIPPNSELWNIDLYQQCRLALISKSIRVIAHTKINNKKRDFIELLNLSLDDKQMEKWFEVNVKSVNSMKIKPKIKMSINRKFKE